MSQPNRKRIYSESQESDSVRCDINVNIQKPNKTS